MEGVQEHKGQQGSCMVGMYHREATCDQDHEKMMVMMEESYHHDDTFISSDESSTSSISYDDEDSSISKESSSSNSSELLDDASSSSSSPSSPRSGGPLYELSGLMNQLPIKRGLSKYYQGKSQSFTSLARVTSLEDLAKKESPYQRKIKACRSYAGGLNNFKSHTQPKPTILKKGFKGSLSNLSCLSRKSSFIGSPRAPLSPIQSIF